MGVVTKIFDIVPGWVYALAIAALLVLAGVQQVRVANAHAATAKVDKEFAEAKATAAHEARKAEQAAREEEHRREKRREELIDEANQRTELAQAAARDADAAAVGLRKRLDGYLAAVRRATADPGSAVAGKGQPGADALDVLAGVLARADDAAGELAAYADRLRIAGLTCEAYADGLQPPHR